MSFHNKINCIVRLIKKKIYFVRKMIIFFNDDILGAYAGPFNEGEDLKLICQVHGGTDYYILSTVKTGFTRISSTLSV